MKIVLLLLIFSNFCFAAQKKLDNRPASSELHSFSSENKKEYYAALYKRDLAADMARYSMDQRVSELEKFQIQCMTGSKKNKK